MVRKGFALLISCAVFSGGCLVSIPDLQISSGGQGGQSGQIGQGGQSGQIGQGGQAGTTPIYPKAAWAKSFGAGGPDIINDLAATADGGVVVVGYFENSIDFGGGMLMSAPSDPATFIARLGPGGEHRHSKSVVSTHGAQLVGVGVDREEKIAVGGWFYDALDFLGKPLMSGGGSDGMLGWLSADGAPIWAKEYGDVAGQSIGAVKVDGDGNIIATGTFFSAINFGAGMVMTKNQQDTFVVKIRPDGMPVWSHSVGGAATQRTAAMTLGEAGDIFLAGESNGTIHDDAGGIPLGSTWDAFLAKVSASGVRRWVRAFGLAGTQRIGALALRPGGGVVLGATTDGTIDFGAGPRSARGGVDAFLVELRADGTHLATLAELTGPGADAITALAGTSSGALIVAGTVTSKTMLGGQAIGSDGAQTSFIAELAADGKLQWVNTFGPDGATVHALAVAADDTVLAGGSFKGAMTLGGVILQASDSEDAFVAKFPRRF